MWVLGLEPDLQKDRQCFWLLWHFSSSSLFFNFTVVLFIYPCVCVVSVSAHVCSQECGVRLTSGTLLCCTSPGAHRLSSISCPESSSCLHLPNAGTAGTHHRAPVFMWLLETQTQALMLLQQALSHPQPTGLYTFMEYIQYSVLI